MARIGQCKNCGDSNHPRGNVFAVKPTWDFEKANDERDQEMLHRLITIRRSLWT